MWRIMFKAYIRDMKNFIKDIKAKKKIDKKRILFVILWSICVIYVAWILIGYYIDLLFGVSI